MTEIEQYEFDRTGYLVIPGMLNEDETVRLAQAVDALVEHAQAHHAEPPHVTSRWGDEYHRNEELGYHVNARGFGDSVLIEDFFNADPAFDCLVHHPRTMPYLAALISGRPSINNSELRVRYPGNLTGAHMGGPVGKKHSYRFYDNRIDCMMIRFIYFVHDVSAEEGAFCVVPGTHKSSFKSPYVCEPQDEPGMVALEAKAGDAILFTENLRHGGVPNRSEQIRKTLHVGYGPFWLKSQNIATMDQDPYLLDCTLERYDAAQKQLFCTYELPR